MLVIVLAGLGEVGVPCIHQTEQLSYPGALKGFGAEVGGVAVGHIGFRAYGLGSLTGV